MRETMDGTHDLQHTAREVLRSIDLGDELVRDGSRGKPSMTEFMQRQLTAPSPRVQRPDEAGLTSSEDSRTTLGLTRFRCVLHPKASPYAQIRTETVFRFPCTASMAQPRTTSRAGRAHVLGTIRPSITIRPGPTRRIELRRPFSWASARQQGEGTHARQRGLHGRARGEKE